MNKHDRSKVEVKASKSQGKKITLKSTKFEKTITISYHIYLTVSISILHLNGQINAVAQTNISSQIQHLFNFKKCEIN